MILSIRIKSFIAKCHIYWNKKNFFSYERMSEKFNEILTGNNEFRNSWSSEGISDKEYQNIFKVWNKPEMETMKDCHNFSWKGAALLLTDVFEKFRNRCLVNYGFCPSPYLIASALSQDTMFSMTKVEKKSYFSWEWEVVFLKFLNDAVKQTMILKNRQNMSYTWKKIIYMVMPCQNFFQRAVLSGGSYKM